jgi:hypothetical protein
MARLINWKLFDLKGFCTEKIHALAEQLHGQLFC